MTQAFDEDYQRLLDEREEGINNIVQGIQQIAEINSDLNTIVNEQGATIRLIEENVESTVKNLKESNSELGGAENYQKKHNRKCFIFMVVVLLILLLILVLIIIIRQT
jgi:t-SNARE complex subunit (syntaxin)